MSNIIFFGDSFASCHKNASGTYQYPLLKGMSSYLDIVAEHYGMNLICHGYGGVSWWYSYQHLLEFIQQHPQEWQDTEVMVMCLTSSFRPKISCPKELDRFVSSKIMSKMPRTDEFQKWAYRHFLNEIATLTQGKKVILLPCFSDETWISVEYRNQFATCAIDLINIARGECATKLKDGTYPAPFQSITEYPNHFGDHNNRALAKELIQKIHNYRPGIFMINERNYLRKNMFEEEWYVRARELVKQYGNNV